MKNVNFTEGRIMLPLLNFAMPVLLALFLQAMYGAVDLWVVGQYSTPAAVSAVSTGSHIMQTLTTVITGLSMGTTVLLGIKIGQKRGDEAGGVIGSSICVFAVLCVVVTALMLTFAGPVAELMQAPEEAFDGTVVYTRICSAGFIFIVAYNVLGSIFRGIGNSKLPLVTVAIACVINIGGDMLFVAVFGMGAAGAAAATVIAQGVSVLLSIMIIKRQQLPFSFSRADLRFDRGIIRNVMRLGVPIALQDLLVSISFLVIMAIVNSLGVIASAGVGVAEKLCGFIMLVPSAYMQSMSAFVSQNFGARKYSRAKKALFCGIATSLCIGVVMGYLSFFHGDILAGIFSKDLQVISAAADYLRAYSIDCLLVSFLFCFAGYFNGCGKTAFVMVQGIAGAFGVRIPIAFIMSRLPEVSLFRVGLSTPASTSLQIILCVIYFIYQNKKEKRLEEQPRYS